MNKTHTPAAYGTTISVVRLISVVVRMRSAAKVHVSNAVTTNAMKLATGMACG